MTERFILCAPEAREGRDEAQEIADGFQHAHEFTDALAIILQMFEHIKDYYGVYSMVAKGQPAQIGLADPGISGVARPLDGFTLVVDGHDPWMIAPGSSHSC
jgi:hypothetical protein